MGQSFDSNPEFTKLVKEITKENDRIEVLMKLIREKPDKSEAEYRELELLVRRVEFLKRKLPQPDSKSDPLTDAATAAAFGQSQTSANSVTQATANASCPVGSSDPMTVCFTAVDDCPEFRLIIKNSLFCKDIKVKEIKLTCTSSNEILLGLKPKWLRDTSVTPPEIQGFVLDAAEDELAAQTAGITFKLDEPNGGVPLESECLLYDVVGTFRKEFTHSLCVPAMDDGEVFAAVNAELEKLRQEQLDITTSTIVSITPIIINVEEGI